jgi:hypothetical protein
MAAATAHKIATLLDHAAKGEIRVNVEATIPLERGTEAFKQHLQPRGLPAALGGTVALVEVLVHHQDIRRPLGLPRTVTPPTPAPTQSSTGPAGSRFWTRRPGVRVHLV